MSETSRSELVIQNLHVSIDGKEILKGLNLTLPEGEVHAIMGPNGTGKSTLAYALMGHPSYEVTEGEVWFKGKNILKQGPDQRSREGIFLAFQYPVSISGVTVANFLRTALNARRKAENSSDKGVPIPEFRKMMKEQMERLKMDLSFAGRYLNEGFSGGEKKRAEILQMAMLKPEIAILDETDFGVGYRCPANCSRGCKCPARTRPGCTGDHALPAHPQLYSSRRGACDAQRSHRRIGRTRAGSAPRRTRLRLGA